MKILVIGKPVPDYQQDDLYHGLKCLNDVTVESLTHFDYMYYDYLKDTGKLYGLGISYAMTISSKRRILVTESDATEKLQNGYYDAVIYLSVWRSLALINIVQAHMPKNKIVYIDGEDETHIMPRPGGLYFKRELTVCPTSTLFPISFAIAEEKLSKKEKVKLRLVSDQIPSGERKYKFKNEDEYYSDYRKSSFAITSKKAGWDCKRHYEIMANRCIPLFADIDKCPEWTLTKFPKKFLAEIGKNWMFVNYSIHAQWREQLYNWTEDKLTTRKLAEYVLDKLS